MAKLESHDVSLISQIPSDASITHGLSPLLANFSQDHVLPGEKLPAESLSAIIQRLNRAIVNSDIIWELGSTSCTRHQPRDSHESWVRYRHRPHPDNEPRQAATSPTSVSRYTRNPSSWALEFCVHDQN